MTGDLPYSSNQSAIDERLVKFCNVFLGSLGIDVGQVGLGRFVSAFTRALSAAGLRLVAYRIEGEGPEGRTTIHGP
mgnify:CR=1 FL=1